MSILTRRHAVGWWLAALVLLGAACGGTAQTSVTQLWKAPIATAPIKTLIVFAAHMDEANRRALEDGYVTALTSHGLTVKQSYVFFPGEAPSREQAKQSVKQAGFDGILVSTLRGVTERQTYVPGWYEGGFWYSYYGPGWDYWSPGYVHTDRVVNFDTTLWDTRVNDQLVFALTTETSNPSSGKDFVRSLTKTVVSALDKQRLIPPEQKVSWR
jgi:hypothetical protein